MKAPKLPMIKMLKVKVKSLAEEARIIHLEEERAKGVKEYHEATKSCVFRGRDDTLRTSLYFHRTRDVRREQRASLLAYGFLRGRTLAQVEPKSKSGPDLTRVQQLVAKFGVGSHPTKDEQARAVHLWLAGQAA